MVAIKPIRSVGRFAGYNSGQVLDGLDLGPLMVWRPIIVFGPFHQELSYARLTACSNSKQISLSIFHFLSCLAGAVQGRAGELIRTTRPIPPVPPYAHSDRLLLGSPPAVLDKGPDPPAIILTQFLDHLVQVLFFVLLRLGMSGFLFAREFLMLDGDTLRPLNGHPI